MAQKRKEVARYHHGDLRRALLDGVLALVAERGGAGDVTLREVARRVGVSHTAPYRHFEDKAALLAAVATEGFAKLSSVLSEARRGISDDQERFVCAGLAYLDFALQHRGYVAIMHGPDVAKARTLALQTAANEAFQLLKQFANDAGVEDVEQARQLGTVIWSFLFGLATLASLRQIPASVGASAEDLAHLGLTQLFRSAKQLAGATP